MISIDLILKDLRRIKEKDTLEFKKATNAVPKSLWETYSSFSNTKGMESIIE